MYGLTPFRRKRDFSPADFGKDFIRDFFDPESWFDFGIKADIKENAREYMVEAELPGMKKDDITLELKENNLIISARQVEAINEEKPNYVRRERRQGNLKRVFYVENVDGENVRAEYKNGLLTVTLPKLQEDDSERHRIEIE